MTSGARSMTSSALTKRSFADLPWARSAKIIFGPGCLDEFRDPGDGADHRLVPFFEIDARADRAFRRRRDSRRQLSRQEVGALGQADHGAEHADHLEDFADAALVEGVNRNAALNEGCSDIGLEIGESEDEIGLEGENFRNVGGCESRDARLLAPRLGRAHDIAGNPHDPSLFAEKVQRLDRLFGQADDALRRKQSSSFLDPNPPQRERSQRAMDFAEP